MFLELLEEEYEKLDEDFDEIVEFLLDAYEDNFEDMQSDLGLDDEEYEALVEKIMYQVNSKGKKKRVFSRAIRHRRATRTRGMSSSALRRAGRKAAKSRKRNPTAARRGLRKRRRARVFRKRMGLS